MVEQNTQEPNDMEADFFKQLTSQFDKIKETSSDSIANSLPKEII